MRLIAAAMLCAVLLSGCPQQSPAPSAAPTDEAPAATALGERSAASGLNTQALRASELISEAPILATVSELGSDAYEGRGPGTTGDEKTRAYLQKALATMGLKPGGADAAWQQTFDLVGVDASQPDTWRFAADGGELSLAQSDDFIVGSGVQQEQCGVHDAEVVFVGYGIQAPEYRWDDFKGVDLRGKVLLMLNNDPDWSPDLFAGERRLYYGRWMYKYESAARQGAAGAIIIHTTASAGYPYQVVQTSWTGPQFELPAADEPRMQIKGWLTEEAAARLVVLAGHDIEALVKRARGRDFEPVTLGVTTTIEFANDITRVQSANVLGLLPGSDPELADEVVVYTTHHDHLGIGKPNAAVDQSDGIYNGARDNASGTGMVLAIAGAFASLAPAPRRSILFAFVGAEEQGLLGSLFFARNPPLPAGKMAANINFDSGNIWGATRDVTYIGLGKSADLDAAVLDSASHQKRTVKPDQFPDRGYFYRSDQFSLARVGVPAIYLKNGTDFVGRPEGWGKEQINAYTVRHYHQPSDELTDDWNFDGMILDARLGFLTGWRIANGDAMPAWNPGDEFEAVRKSALAAAP